ncbi:MAG: hypothetical protein RIB59_13000, partial [Rhodospirillales bacterium]
DIENAPDDALVRVSDAGAALPKQPAAWLIPAGLGGHLDLAKTLAATKRPIMIAVNGLGYNALQALHVAMKTGELIHLFDARDQDMLAYTEQLAWLRAQARPFAIMARSTEKLVLAAAMGPHSLIVPDAVDIDLGPILRIARAQGDGAARPTSPAEVDHLHGREASLTVNKPKRRGETMTLADLTVIVSEARGISPVLRDHIVGKVLRYDIEPSESLSFGHLEDKPAS